MEKQASRSTSRRGFFGIAGGILAGATASVMVRYRPAMAEEVSPDRKTGYRETPHVRKVYALARF